MDLRVSGVMVNEKSSRTEIPRSFAWLLVFCAVSTQSVITPYWEVQMTWGLLCWKVDLFIFPTMYSLHHETLQIGTFLQGKLSKDKSSSRLLTFWPVLSLLMINFYWRVYMTCGSLCWKVDLIRFPTNTHGPSYLLGIKSYSCFFWWSELVVWIGCPNWFRLVRTGWRELVAWLLDVPIFFMYMPK